ncbi:hypothetical protein JX265_008724 [Neoarthrinium moseri]|uniref:LrgB-like protein n=1 Tax=Neoarthrinium moseri TaxID=1658444 RepID=A0A9Q0AJT4_9PEZI|nr:hypothetical protein JX265_008724 [Neoarthrinium moseri]
MTAVWISHVCRAIGAPETKRKYWNAVIGILLVPLVQLLVTPIQLTLDSRGIDLPASILVMTVVTVAMLMIESMHSGIGSLYVTHMKGPTDFLGRHMSLGFVAPFVMLSRDHITTSADIPRIAGAFVVTTFLSYVGSFLFATGSYKLEERVRGLRKRTEDLEKATKPSPPSSRFAKRVSQVTKLTDVLANNGSLTSLDTLCAPSATVDFVVRTAPLWIPLSLLVTVGLPVYCATNYDLPFETFCFIVFWAVAVLFQRYIKSCKKLELHLRLRSTLAVVFNPVLLTSALGTAYFWTKAAVTHRVIGDILNNFKSHSSWANIIREVTGSPSAQHHVGAGDLSMALLDAGIVSLGLKMFEYRRELCNSFTTVFSTSLVFATINVFLNVIFARAMGLQPADALAFAARNVTIALGVPAVQHLGGSTTLMSSLVVFSGMLFQMTGDLLFSWLGIHDRPLPANVTYTSDGENGGTNTEENVESATDAKVIAAGVTVGINAAAMGTAQLIERGSMATAYSALSMTVFGAITVALTAVPVVADCLVTLASR